MSSVAWGLVVLALALPFVYYALARARTGRAQGGRVPVGLHVRGQDRRGRPKDVRLPAQAVDVPVARMREWLPGVTSAARQLVAWDLLRLIDLVFARRLPHEVVAVHAGGPFFDRALADDPAAEADEDTDLYHCWLVVQVEPEPGAGGVLITPEGRFLAEHVAAPLQDEAELERLKRTHRSPVSALQDLVRAAIQQHPDSAPEDVSPMTLAHVYMDWLYGLDWAHCKPHETPQGPVWPWTPQRLFRVLLRRNILTLTLGPVITVAPGLAAIEQGIRLHRLWEPGDTVDVVARRIREAMASQ